MPKDFKAKLNVVEVDIDLLKPSEYNPRKSDDKSFNDLKHSIQEFGLVDPIIANSAKERLNVVIGGHFRLRVAKDLGFAKVPVVYLNIQDIKKEQELNLRLNKNTGEWDWGMLANINPEILLDSGFTNFELDSFISLHDVGDFAKDDLTDIADEVKDVGEGKPVKNENWFYIEFYGDDKKFNEIKKLLGEALKTGHEIHPDLFYKMVKEYAKK